MIEALRKKSLKSFLLGSIILLICGLGLLIWNGPECLYAIMGYEQFSELEPGKIKNQLVDVELVENFGCYMEEWEENSSTHRRTTTDYYYIIYTGSYDDVDTDYKFMTIKVPAKYGSKMDEMSDNTYNGYLSDPMSFSGQICRLDDEEYDLFVETWEEMGYTSQEIADTTLPYYIKVFASKGSMNSMYIITSVLGLFFTIFSVFRIIKGVKGGHLKKFRKDIEAAGYTEASLESDFASATSYTKKEDLKIGRLFTYCSLNTSCPRAFPNAKIIWAYQNTVTHRTNGIKTGTTYNVLFYVEGYKNCFSVSVPSEDTAQQVLQLVNARFPWVVVGYSEELKKMYNKDRAAFLALRYNTVEHVAVEPGFENQ